MNSDDDDSYSSESAQSSEESSDEEESSEASQEDDEEIDIKASTRSKKSILFEENDQDSYQRSSNFGNLLSKQGMILMIP